MQVSPNSVQLAYVQAEIEPSLKAETPAIPLINTEVLKDDCLANEFWRINTHHCLILFADTISLHYNKPKSLF